LQFTEENRPSRSVLVKLDFCNSSFKILASTFGCEFKNLWNTYTTRKGVGRKIFRRGQRKRPKNSTIKPLPGGGGATEK